jgi:hypothetical protein
MTFSINLSSPDTTEGSDESLELRGGSVVLSCDVKAVYKFDYRR